MPTTPINVPVANALPVTSYPTMAQVHPITPIVVLLPSANYAAGGPTHGQLFPIGTR